MAIAPTSETLAQARDGMVKSLMDVAQIAQAGHLSGLLVVGILTDGRQSVSTVLDGRTHPFILTGAVQAHLNQTADAVLRSVASQSQITPLQEEVTPVPDAATDPVSANHVDLAPES